MTQDQVELHIQLVPRPPDWDGRSLSSRRLQRAIRVHRVQADRVLELPDADAEELERLGRRLRADMLEMEGVHTVDPVSAGLTPDGTKAVDWNLLGEWIVKLGAAAVPSLFTLLKDRQKGAPASAPLKLKMKTGRHRQVEVEYDPAHTTPEQLAELVKQLEASLTKK